MKTQVYFLLLAAGILGLSRGHLFAQSQKHETQEAVGDSLNTDDWSEETLYAIEKLRVERWLRENSRQLTPSLAEQVQQLLAESAKLAAAGDYYLANIWLETIWELIEPSSPQTAIDSFDQTDGLFGDDLNLAAQPQNNVVWTREIISGVDVWRQELNFAFFDQDSTFLDGSGNPYTGFRFNLDYSNKNNLAFQATSFFKYSYDYFTGDIDLRLKNPVTSYLTWTLENRFEGTSFFRDFDLKYIQNLAIVDMRLQNIGPLYFELRDDLLLRRYQDETSTYPNYLNNTFYGTIGLNSGLRSSVSLGYRNINRSHPVFKTRDYRENRFNFNWLQFWGSSSFSVDNELKYRDYLHPGTDQIYQDYWEEYLQSELKLMFWPAFGLNIESTFTKRDYKFVNENSLPDFTYWESEPALLFHLGNSWNLSTGIVFGQQVHQELADKVAPDVRDVTFNIVFEDYTFWGPTFTLEFFQVNGLLFSIRESYLFKRYPNNPTPASATDFLPYSDRNINSILLYLTWNVSKHWQFNVIANMDDERIQNEDTGDSQNTIVGAEISFQF